MNAQKEDMTWLEALAANFAGGNRNISRTPSCPDELHYFDFVEDQPLAPEIHDHISGCPHCLQRAARVAQTILAEESGVVSALDQKILARSQDPQKLGANVDGKVSFSMTMAHLALNFSSLPQVTGYRSQDPNVVVVKTNVGKVEIRYEFIRNQDETQLAVEVRGLAMAATCTAEVWNERGLLRDSEVVSGRKTALVKAGRGDYLIKLLVDDEVQYNLAVNVV